MDPATSTLIAASIGGLIGFGTTWLNNYFTSKREARQWANQQEAERDKRRHEEKTEERNRRREMFQNVLTQLSTFETFQPDESIPKEDQRRRIEEAQKWLNLLSLNVHADEHEHGKAFHETVQNFFDDPANFAEDMRAVVVKLSLTDKLLFPEAAKTQKRLPSPKEPPGIEFRLSIADSFRREQLVKAIQLPQQYAFKRQLSELTESQRELLVNIYYESSKHIPSQVYLPMPLPTPSPKNPYRSGGVHWEARVDPLKTSPDELLRLWEHDYKEEFSKIHSKPSEDEGPTNTH